MKTKLLASLFFLRHAILSVHNDAARRPVVCELSRTYPCWCAAHSCPPVSC